MMEFAGIRGGAGNVVKSVMLAGALCAGATLALLPSSGLDLAVAAEAKSRPVAADASKAVAVRLCDPTEAGKRLLFGGRVLDMDGRPLAKAAVVAYQTDALGHYNAPNAGTRVPRLRGVAVTAEDGSFRFETIRPGAYPQGGVPSHIHVIVTAPAHNERYLEFWFEDDPLVTSARRRDVSGNDGFVIVAPRAGADGVPAFQYDIRLRGN